MLVLGIEFSCDETGVALYDIHPGLRAHALYSQITMHREYGGVASELASCDHIRHMIPLFEEVLGKVDAIRVSIDAITYTKGPGLASVPLVDASVANALAFVLGEPLVAMCHLKGHPSSPLLETDRPEFLFLALLTLDGHTQLMHIGTVGQYILFGETLDGAVDEAFDKTTRLLGLGYSDGPAVSRLVEFNNPGVPDPSRPMLHSGDFDFLFAGPKTAVLAQIRKLNLADNETYYQSCVNLAHAFADATVEVLTKKTLHTAHEHGLKRIVMTGGVGVNRQLREGLNIKDKKCGLRVYYPSLQSCTDNGVMTVLTGTMWLQVNPAQVQGGYGYGVTPRWNFENICIRHA